MNSPMHRVPEKKRFTRREWQIIEAHRTPRQVQRFLCSLPYNWERNGGTLGSFRQVVRRGRAHCLEAALAAAVILEQYGYPPLLLSLESQDRLDHVIFVFRHRDLWGAVGRSRDLGLHGRRPVYRNLRQLAWSYFDPYVDNTGRITGYGLADLDDLGGCDWRFSNKNVWKVERFLCDVPHHKLRSSNKRYEKLLARYREFRRREPEKQPTYFTNRAAWLI